MRGGTIREWAALRPVYIKVAIRIFYFRGCPSSVLWGGPRLDIAPPPHRRVILALPYKLNNPAPSDTSDRALMLMLLVMMMRKIMIVSFFSETKTTTERMGTGCMDRRPALNLFLLCGAQVKRNRPIHIRRLRVRLRMRLLRLLRLVRLLTTVRSNAGYRTPAAPPRYLSTQRYELKHAAPGR